MEKYLTDWITIVDEMVNDTTYKAAWGRGIIECVYLKEYQTIENEVVMKQSDIANKMIKYYWNQTIFFELSQGKNAVILKIVETMIEKYNNEVDTFPKPWNEVEEFFYRNNKFYKSCISKVLSNARVNVCPKFLNVGNKKVLDIYKIDANNRLLIFEIDDIKVLEEYASVLSKLFNYKWAQLLERFNTAPNISKKVNASNDREIRRSNLIKYRNLLLKYYHNSEIRDFYSGEVLDVNDIHIDHVIPWSYVYTDEIWNLVVTSSTNNIRKGKKAPSQEEIERLKFRNQELLKKLDEEDNKYKKSIDYALNHNLIEKLYINMKG